MSAEFGCDVAAVQATAGQLAKVTDELTNFARRGDDWQAALGSDPIREALRAFSDDSSDRREKITQSVDVVHSMLQGLVDGVRAVDEALTRSLTQQPANGGAGR